MEVIQKMLEEDRRMISLWVNPDCGLKTRGEKETKEQPYKHGQGSKDHTKYVTKLCDNFWQLFKSTVKSADYSAFFVILYIPNIESIS